MLLGTFLTDVDKAYDFLELSKVEFLESYSYLTGQEYEEACREFVSDIPYNLAELMRDAENMLIEENTYVDNEHTNPYKYASITGEQLKDRVYSYAQSHLSKEEMEEFQNACEDMAC